MEISSDSEDDCYGNVAKRLENLKQKYQDDNIESTNLLDDSVDTQSKTSSKNKNSIKTTPDNSILGISDDELLHDIELEKLLAMNAKGRVTRSSKRKSNTDSSILETSPDIINSSSSSSSKRGKRGGRTTKNSTMRSIMETAEMEIICAPRGRSRGRVRQNRPRRVTSNNIQTISIGNTMDYPDNSETQTLFSGNVDNDVVLIEDNDLLDENEELFLKVYWQSSEIFKFSIRKYQKLKPIFRHFSEKENVSENYLLFTYNDTILKPDDTPDSINYNIAKFIDGGLLNRPVTILINDDYKKESGGIKLKFQCQNIKKPYETSIQLNDKLALAMMKCAEHLELPLTKLKFKFDGDSISGTMTPKDLELEGGECIDVKILN